MRLLDKFWVSLAAVLLAACGGGGGNPGTCGGSAEVCRGVQPSPAPATGSARGLYRGTTGDGRALTAILRDDARLWLVYGTGTTRNGFWEGLTQFVDDRFQAVDVREVTANAANVRTGTASGTFAVATSISGTVNTSTPVNFSGTFDTAYTDPTTAAAAAGNYAGTAVVLGSAQPASFAVGTGGAVNGTFGDTCQFSGTLIPDTEIAVFAVTFSFGGTTCPIGLTSATGVAWLESGRLHVATINAARTNGFILSATRT